MHNFESENAQEPVPTTDTQSIDERLAQIHADNVTQREQWIAEDKCPVCKCGLLAGEHNLGLVCHACGTKCHHKDDTRNPTVEIKPINDNPTQDYVSFEQYLNLMRQMHAYETMAPADALQFDNACTYRWRDIKALRVMFNQVESGTTNPMTRFTAELRRVNDLLDSAYLEMSHLRRLIGLEMAHYQQLAKRATAKKQTTLSMQFTALVSRLGKATAMQGRVRQSTDVQELNTALRDANILVDSLTATIAAEAQECYKHVGTKRDAGDIASADRHQARGDRLMAALPTNRNK